MLTKKAAPPELIRLRMIKLYGGPSELERVGFAQALEDLTVESYEQEALAIKYKTK